MTLQTVAAAEPFVPPRRRSEVARKAFFYAVIVLVAALFFIPFIYTLTTSFKTLPDAANVTFIPHPWTTSAWHTIWTQYDFKTYIKNSVFLAVVVTVCNIFLAGLGGYAFARLKFPGRELLFCSCSARSWCRISCASSRCS